MPVSAVSLSPNVLSNDWLIVPVTENASADADLSVVDTSLPSRLEQLRSGGDLTAAPGEILELRDSIEGQVRRILVVGLGDPAKLTAGRYETCLLTAVRRLTTKLVPAVAVQATAPQGSALSPGQTARIAAQALTVGGSGAGLYKAKQDRFPIRTGQVAVSGSVSAEISQAVEEGGILGEAVNLTRELVNRQPDEIYPESFADRASQLAVQYGLSCDILDERRLEAERMGSLLAVAKGSARPPRVVVLSYRGAGADAPVLALVGKGVTFDSGGLSLKPSDGMKTMKCDMAGGATVLSSLVAIARLHLKVNVTAYIGLVENMPGSRSYKLGDVLTARNGMTIEVHNTDAEGRLVLADVLAYAVDQKVAKIVDLATLTGACVVALGEEIAGGFTNDQGWYDAVSAGSKVHAEELWQLPMLESFDDQLKSDVADCKNVGTRWGGAITAARFLQKFVGETPWVHLDIAGPAFAEGAKPHRESGATGAYTRTLVEVARAFG